MVEKSEPQNNEQEEQDITETSSISFSGELEKAMMQIVNITGNIIHEPTCIICSSAYRTELEQKYLETKSCEECKKILQGKGITVSSANIENHMLYHVTGGIKELQKVEYISKIRRLNNNSLTTLDIIQLCLSALTERLIGINSIVPDSNLSQAEIDRMKASETSRLMASFGQILKIKAMIEGVMKNNGDLIVLPRQNFIKVFNEAFIEAKTETEKNIINKILVKLSSQDIK